MPYTFNRKFLRATQTTPNSGNLRDLIDTAGTGALYSTVGRWVAGEAPTNAYRLMIPNIVNAGNSGFQDPNNLPTIGWRQPAGTEPNVQMKFASGNWILRLTWKRSGQLLEQDMNFLFGWQFWVISAPGDSSYRLAESYSGTLVATTIAQSINLNTGIGEALIAEGEKIFVEVVVIARDALGNDAAPTVATDFHLGTDASDANNGSSFTTPNYTKVWTRNSSASPSVTDSAQEAFTTLPTDLVKNSGDTNINAGRLRSDGNGDWWYFTGGRFSAIGDFTLVTDLTHNVSAANSRNIANLAFWVSGTPGAAANGFFFRLDTAAQGTTGHFFRFTNGDTDQAITTTITTSVVSLPKDVVLRTQLTATGNIIRAVTTRQDTGAIVRDVSCDVTAHLDANHPKSGVFGQKNDAAGSLEGHFWDNFSLGSGGVSSVTRSVPSVRSAEQVLTTADTPTRNLGSVRSTPTQVTTVTDTPSRLIVVGRNPATESVPTQYTVQRATAGDRAISESRTTTDTPTRSAALARTAAEVTSQTSTPARTYLAGRSLVQAVPTTDNTQRTIVVSRSAAEALVTSDAIFRSITQGRFLAEFPSGVTPDWAPDFPVKKVDGYVRDSTGAIVVGATVKLFRQSDDKMVQTTTSSATGYYQFLRDLYDPNTYYILAYLGVAPQRHGVSDRGFIPEPV